jgi:hypothetical protein
MPLDELEGYAMITMHLRTAKAIILLKQYMQEHAERAKPVCTCLICIQAELLVNPIPRAVGGNTLTEEEWVRYHEGSDEYRKQIDDMVRSRSRGLSFIVSQPARPSTPTTATDFEKIT